MLGLLGDEWNLFIIRYALMGMTHYGQFLNQLPISNSVLTNRLHNLVQHGLLAREEIPSIRARTQYLTTPRSRSLWPAMLAMWVWERDWVTERHDTLPEMHHTSCGELFTPVLQCRTCSATVTVDDVSIRLGPSGDWTRFAPDAVTRRRSVHAPGVYPETMSVFGNRWSAALLVAAFLGTTRFTEFQTQLGAPPSSVAERLHMFCEIDVLVTSPTEEEGPQRAEYLLTDKGRAFFPVLALVLEWAQRWFHAPEGPAVALTHNGCGNSFHGELACDQCQELLSGIDVQAKSAATHGDDGDDQPNGPPQLQ
jgi:DNA-binding HxlR family transcriptional regulator